MNDVLWAIAALVAAMGVGLGFGTLVAALKAHGAWCWLTHRAWHRPSRVSGQQLECWRCGRFW